MTYLWHDFMNQIWSALFVLGIIFGGLVWLALALSDSIRGFFRRIWGE
jgi:hypothetical protein